MMPGMDGLEVMRRMHESDRVSVILLTARGEPSDRVIGLRLGADDYVVKPFSPAELVARVDAVLRRVAPEPELRGPDRVRRPGAGPGGAAGHGSRPGGAAHGPRVRPAAALRAPPRPGVLTRPAHGRASGATRSTPTPPPSPCTCAGCGPRSRSTRPTRAGCRPCGAWVTGSSHERVRPAARCCWSLAARWSGGAGVRPGLRAAGRADHRRSDAGLRRSGRRRSAPAGRAPPGAGRPVAPVRRRVWRSASDWSRWALPPSRCSCSSPPTTL